MKAITVAVLVLVCIVAIAVAQPPTFPNIGYLGAGYDYYFGSPHTVITSDAPDPGYRQFVFNLTIYQGQLTPDQKYRIPKGTQIQLCDACSVDWKTKNITGSQTYQHILDDSVSASIGFFGAHFSASYDYKTVNQHTTSYSDIYTETAAECCVYKGQLQSFNTPPLSNNFMDGVKEMPTTYNSNSAGFFNQFIQAFGTHYTSYVTMGGRFGQRSRITGSSWSKLISSDLSVSASAGFSAQSFSAAVKVMSTDDKSQASSYSSLTEDQSLFSIGGTLPASFQVADWITTSKDNPMPLATEIHQLTNLFNSVYFPNDPQIAAKGNALESALKNYCSYLLSQGKVPYCGAPPPAPPPPPPSIFGGIYQQDGCNKENVQNIYTGALNCKPGYNPTLIGKFISNSGCNTNQFICLLAGHTSDPLKTYGGMYQVEGTFYQPGWSLPNPLTNALSCPTGYTPVEVGRVLIAYDSSNSWGATQYGCYNMSAPMTNLIMAGGYQSMHNAYHDAIPNPYTKAQSCPSGFTSYMSGRIVGPDTRNLERGWQYVCLNNVFLGQSEKISASEENEGFNGGHELNIA
eukprot:TRINITY_DN271_c0_g2_i1.p1 TRINITY_DN271_c0_g2~~TRINITY_DN271_c0_g2_i1.p1  ORF type:complete len:573 (-),score=155.92 TRINITY_DN271_c0_g2_i1:30-1748(-)